MSLGVCIGGYLRLPVPQLADIAGMIMMTGCPAEKMITCD